jgi:FlaG/FlaF family flagellin (archaellin)
MIILAKISQLMSPREILNILGIVLPASIIIISLSRPSLKNIAQKAGRARLVNSLVMFLAVLLLLAGLVRFFFFPGNGSRPKDPPPQSLDVSKHSEAFNQSIQSLLDAYYGMTEAFVNWDSVGVNKHAADVKGVFNNFNITELVDTTGGKVDSTIYITVLDYFANAQSSNDAIMSLAGLDNKRKAFNDLSDNMRLFFVTVKPEEYKVYWNECPMAFGDNVPGFWLSKTDEVRNPYMGLHHPVYKDEMLKCGGPKDTIFFPADTTRK